MALKKSPVFRRWMISYLIILGFPLLFSVVTYFFSQRVIFRTSQEIYGATLDNLRNEVDSQLQILQNVLDHVIINSDAQYLYRIQGDLNPDDYFFIYKTVNDLKTYQLINPLLDDVLIVINQTDTITGKYGHLPLDIFFELSMQESDISIHEFTEIMKKSTRKTFFQTGDNLFLLQNIPFNSSESRLITVVLVVRISRFRDLYLRNFASEESILFITNGDNMIIGSTGEDVKQPLLNTMEKSVTGTINFDNMQYYTLHRGSTIVDWNFLYLISKDMQKQKATQIQALTFGGFLLCSLFGVFFSIRSTRRNYGEYRDIELSLEDNIRVLRKYYLYTLLEKPFDKIRDSEEMERYEVRFPGNCFTVILFDMPQTRQNTSFFELMKLFQETAVSHFRTEITNVGPNIAAIVNWSSLQGESGNNTELLEKDIEEVQLKIKERFGLTVLAALGETHQGIEGIYYSNLEAGETLQYLKMNSGESILHYREIRYSGDSYYYPLEIEQKLINLIRTGDFEKAWIVLKQIIDNNAQAGISEHLIKILTSDLAGTMMKGLLAPETTIPIEPPPGGLLPETITGYFEKALGEICAANRSFLEGKHSHNLGERVKKFIEENFRDPDLNISITALRFGLTPAYLSSVFQQDTGLSLLGYINSLRIEESKKLLEQGQSINKTAELVGFRSSNTFIRIFRKITGLTPGRHKNIN